jgi:Family of unknown function (DUF6507)
MTKWDIDPVGVRAVLINTENVAKEFDGQMTTLNAGLHGATVECSSSIVASALAGFAESASSSITFVFTRTGACLAGAAAATNAYVQGDLQMAATAQASATLAPDAADLPGTPRGATV